MATPVFCCGFECGVFASSAHFSSSGGTPTVDTTTFRTGLGALRCNPTATQEYVRRPTSSDVTTRHVGRFYIRFATLPSADCGLNYYGTLTTGPNVRFKQSDSKIYAAVGTTFGATGVAVTTGQWYRIDYDFNVNIAGNDACDVQVDGSACGQATGAGTSTSDSRFELGIRDTCTADIYIDDFLLSATAADYPLGAGHVNSYIPNADGTHNVAGANDFEFASGTDITNATTTANTVIARRPLPTSEAADYIEGTAPPNATDYVEWQYEDSTEGAAPRAVEAIIAVTDATGAGTYDITVTLREHAGGTSANIVTGTGSGGATVRYHRAHFATVPGTADAWTETKFNALRSRFLVSDASPDPRINAAMLEAEWAEVDSGATGTIAATLQKATAALTGEQPTSGAIAATAQMATASLTGVMQPSGSIAATLAMATAALAGLHSQAGAIASTLQPATASLTGTQTQTGAVASTLQFATASLSGTLAPSGSIAATLQMATAALSGTQTQTGTIAATLAAATASLTGVMQPSGSIASTLQAATAALTGTHEQTGAIASTLQAATAALTGTHVEGENTGTVAATLQPATAALAGTHEQTGTIAATLTAATAALTGTMHASGSIASTLQPATASATGEMAGVNPDGAIASALQPATASLTGTQTQTGSVASSLQPATASLAGTQEQSGAIASSLQPATASLTAEQVFIGTISATLQMATGSLVGQQPTSGQIAATLQILSVALLGTHEITGTIAAILQYATAAANDIQPSPRIVNLDGSYVPITDMVASVLMAVLEGSYVSVTNIDGSVLHPVIDGSYVAIQELEGSR
jgi:hypothetical protein